MTENQKSDRGLLLAIGGVVVAGAAGIALIAGMQSGEETQGRTAQREAIPAARVAKKAPAPVVEPAVSTYKPTEPAGVPESVPEVSIPEVSIELPAEPLFQVDPNADFVVEGQRAYALRKFDESVAYFQAATDTRPDHSWSHYMLGLSQWKSGDNDGAAASLERAGELNPEGIKTWINLSRVQNDRGEFQAALDAAKRAKEIDSLNATALFVEGRSLYNLGQVDEAENVLVESRQYDADNGYVANLLGLIQLQQGRELAAVVTLTEAAEATPGAAFIHNNLGMALERAGQETEALAAFRKALECNPNHAKAAVSLARIEARVGSETPIPVKETEASADAVAEAAVESDETVTDDSGDAESGSS